MTDEEYLEKILEFTSTEGWLIYRKELIDWADSLEKIMSIKDDKDLYNKQGQLAVLNILINLEDSTKMTLDQFDNDVDLTN